MGMLELLDRMLDPGNSSYGAGWCECSLPM